MSCKATRRIGYALDGVNFFVAAMQASFGVFVTVYLVRSHWAAQDIGFALAISTAASLCSQIPAGALIDAIPDKRRPVRIGLLGIGAAGHAAVSKREDATEIQLGPRSGPQPFQPGTSPHHPRNLQTETHGRSGLAG